jgi:hypothetical protein
MQIGMPELSARLRRFSRGRPVDAHFENQDFILALDYTVSYDCSSDSFRVLCRKGGCFEGAYRCLERWIESKAEQLDGLPTVPDGFLDLRKDMTYWTLERIYEQIRQDVERAVTSTIEWIERTRPNEGVFGEVTIETRLKGLRGIPLMFSQADDEVRRGVLSAQTITLLRQIGIDLQRAAG